MSFDRILVIGARGQLGSALLRQDWPVGTFVLPATRDQLDITEPAAVWAYLLRWRPRVVINAAAYTAVDRAEDEPELAAAVNGRAVSSIVQGVGAIGARLIHLSTDYVFDGATPGWYREGDQVSPLNAYGRSKRAGELAALELDDSLVIRTSGLYSGTGPNFVSSIRHKARAGERLQVVDDQRCCPTSADDLARALVVAVRSGLNHSGLFHVAAPDDATWWEVADEVLRLDGRRDEVRLERRGSQPDGRRQANGRRQPNRRRDDSSPIGVARRPKDSRLSSDAFAAAYEHTLPPWRTSLAAVCAQLRRQDRMPVEEAVPS